MFNLTSIVFLLLVISQSPFKTQIEFSGMKWGVFTNYDKMSESQFTKDGVFLDSLGHLHLKAWRGKKDSGYSYFASGIISMDKYLYGVYKFETYGNLSIFYNTCLGLFLYDWDLGVYEFDIEYSRWSKKENNPAHYNVHYMPRGKHYRKHFDFELPDSVINAFHYIYLYPDSVVFKTTVIEDGKEKTYGFWVLDDKRFIPKRPVYIEIYLWWPKRKGSGEDEREIVIKKVEYFPFESNVKSE